MTGQGGAQDKPLCTSPHSRTREWARRKAGFRLVFKPFGRARTPTRPEPHRLGGRAISSSINSAISSAEGLGITR